MESRVYDGVWPERVNEMNADLQRVSHGVRDTHEFGKDERCLVRSLLADNVFHRSCVHAIPQWSDQRQIRHREQRVKVVLLDSLVIVVHGNEVQTSVFAIDIRNQLANLPLQLRGVGQAG